MTQMYTRSGVTVKTGANLDAMGTALQNPQIKSAASIVNKAIDCLCSADRKVRYHWLHSDVAKYARRYFLVGANGPTQAQRNHILAIIVLTKNGLKADRTVVIDEHGLNPDAKGWASAIPVANNQVANEQLLHPERRFHPNPTANDTLSYGEINVSDSLLTGAKKEGVVTFIHEATHRYANTQDFDPHSVSSDGVTFDVPGLTQAQALDSAESYGWFIYKVGR